MRRLADDVVALAYTVTEDLTVEGRKVALKAHDSSVWIRRTGAGCAWCTPNRPPAIRSAGTSRPGGGTAPAAHFTGIGVSRSTATAVTLFFGEPSISRSE